MAKAIVFRDQLTMTTQKANAVTADVDSEKYGQEGDFAHRTGGGSVRPNSLADEYGANSAELPGAGNSESGDAD